MPISIIDNHCLSVKKTLELQGCDIDLNHCIDALPVLAVLGCYALGKTILRNVGVARTKECDRLSVITQELRKMGAQIEEGSDYLVIHHSSLHAARVASHHDHRIAMALVVAGCGIKGKTFISEVDCISKTYPNFYEDMRSLGCLLEVENGE